MDVINAYLETMFSPYPETPRLNEAKAELRAMMEDAYTAALAAGRSQNEAVGQVITEFGNLDEVAPVLGITAELAPSTVYGENGGATAAAPPVHPPVTFEEARGFSEATRRTHPRLAVAVALFVLSPIVLITGALANRHSETGLFGFMGDEVIFIGIVIVLVMVAAGIGIITSMQRHLGPYSRISEGRFTPDPVITAWAQKQKDQHEGRRLTAIVIAVTLFILSALPPIASGLLDNALAQHLKIWGVPITLAMVAVGLLILIPPTWAESVKDRLQKGSTSPAGDEDETTSYPAPVRVLMALLWPITIITYLLWSFLGSAWHISWILFPVAGMLTWGLGAIGDALKKD